jgi:hypothetical protein
MDVVEAMSSELRAQLDRIRSPEDDVLSGVRKRYEVACLVRHAHEAAATHGRRPIAFLADALGRGYEKSTLYKYLAVARRWKSAEFKRISERRNCRGEHLAWSHWELLAKRDDWHVLLDRALTAGWGSRELASHMGKRAGARVAAHVPRGPRGSAA